MDGRHEVAVLALPNVVAFELGLPHRFLGGAVVRGLLARGDEVVSVARGDYPHLRELGVQTLRGDLAEPTAALAAVEGCSAVVHVAALQDFGEDVPHLLADAERADGLLGFAVVRLHRANRPRLAPGPS